MNGPCFLECLVRFFGFVNHLEDPLDLLTIKANETFTLQNILCMAVSGLDAKLVQSSPFKVRRSLSGFSNFFRDSGNHS